MASTDGRAAAQAEFEAKLEEQRAEFAAELAAERQKWASRAPARSLPIACCGACSEFEGARGGDDGAHPEAVPRRRGASAGDCRAAGQPRRAGGDRSRRQPAHQRSGGCSRGACAQQLAEQDRDRRPTTPSDDCDVRDRGRAGHAGDAPQGLDGTSSKRRRGEGGRRRHQGARAGPHPPAGGRRGRRPPRRRLEDRLRRLHDRHDGVLSRHVADQFDRPAGADAGRQLLQSHAPDRQHAASRAGSTTSRAGSKASRASKARSATPRKAKQGKTSAKDESAGQGAPRRDPAAKGDGDRTRRTAGRRTARYTEQALFSDPYGVLARIAAEAPTEADAGRRQGGRAARRSSIAIRSIRQRSTSQPDKRADQPKAKAAPAAKNAADSARRRGQDASRTQTANAQGRAGPATEKRRLQRGGEAKAQQENAAAPARDEPARRQGERAGGSPGSAAKPRSRQAAQKAAAGSRRPRSKATSSAWRSQLQGTLPEHRRDGHRRRRADQPDRRLRLRHVCHRLRRAATGDGRHHGEDRQDPADRIREPLIVRGHTDGRPYRSGTYDNWRLSTARAHMAYYMLVRGGVDEKRFERVEGYADRSLRVPQRSGSGAEPAHRDPAAEAQAVRRALQARRCGRRVRA